MLVICACARDVVSSELALAMNMSTRPGAVRMTLPTRPVVTHRTIGDVAARRLTDEQYRELLAFRTGLRRFLHWSDEQATAAGVTAQQHQLLLAIRGHEGPEPATVSDLAAHLLLRHHSTVELIDRAEQAGLVQRVGDAGDRRVVRVQISPRGRRLLERLSAAHLEELGRLAPIVRRLVAGLDRDDDREPAGPR